MLHETTETSLRALCEEPNIMYQQISSTLQSDRRDHNVALTLYLVSQNPSLRSCSTGLAPFAKLT